MGDLKKIAKEIKNLSNFRNDVVHGRWALDWQTKEPVVIGLSLGGMVAQEYAVKYQSNLKGLVLADTAVATALTVSDKLTKAMFPAWMVKWTIRRMSDESYANWSFKFFEMDEEIREYLKAMVKKSTVGAA